MEPEHFASPFTFTSKGAVETVVQESEQDHADRTVNVCLCVQGTREDNPAFGIPDLTFTTVPLNTAELQSAIERWAELAVTTSEAEEAFHTARRRVTVEVS